MNIRELFEGDIVDFDSARKDRELKTFHRDFMGKVKQRTQNLNDVVKKMKEMGLFDELPIGTRIKLPKGGVYSVLGYTANSSRTGEETAIGQRIRQEHNFGPALFIPFGDRYYTPMVYLENLKDGSKGGHNLDKLINQETGEKRFIAFTGPQR